MNQGSSRYDSSPRVEGQEDSSQGKANTLRITHHALRSFRDRVDTTHRDRFVPSFRGTAKIIFIFLFTVYCLLSTVSHASTLDDAIDRIEKRFSEMQDMQGGFSQTSHLKDLDRDDHYEGKFFIKKPSGVMWEYSKPRDEEVIIGEGMLGIHKKSEKQIFKSTFSKDTSGQVPLALLNSMGNLRADFDITSIKGDVIELKPRHKIGSIKKIQLETDTAGFPVKAFTIFDTYGNKINIKMNNIKVNTGIKDSFFIFKPPADAEIFDMND
ncbi:MAG: outer membrane lipoprotein carrier protein LolA [Nitrospirae bacterium]|nr:outer membrane lipoprotein carrier protein LolA [Nitrospirota bacterium]